MPILDLETRRAREDAMLADPRVIVQRRWPTDSQIAKAGGVGTILIMGNRMYEFSGGSVGLSIGEWANIGYYDGDKLANMLGGKYTVVEQFTTEETLIQRIQRKLKERE